MNCRFCNSKLKHIFADLGKSPIANSYLKRNEINKMEPFYPLCAYVCSKCFLVQVDEFEKAKNIFKNYIYFSSYSKTWLDHVKKFAVESIKKFKIEQNTHVVEIASNDGYLLKYFKKSKIPILGIEPAKNIAKIANKNKIPTIPKFFGVKTAKDLVKNGKKADFLIAFNVLPHVPNLKDFVKGLKILLKPEGIIVIQFSAYLMSLIQKTAFDNIYHEHFSYFSLYTLNKIFSAYGLKIFNAKELSIHGGSLRIYATHSNNNKINISKKIKELIIKEKNNGLKKISTYTNFNEKVKNLKPNIRKFFIDAQKKGKTTICYGAPAKGNTLLNYCGITNDLIVFTVDISPHKQGLYLPGTHIPIYSPEYIKKVKPDYIVILPWNLKAEIMEQLSFIRKWKGKFVIPIPNMRVV